MASPSKIIMTFSPEVDASSLPALEDAASGGSSIAGTWTQKTITDGSNSFTGYVFTFTADGPFSLNTYYFNASPGDIDISAGGTNSNTISRALSVIDTYYNKEDVTIS